MIAVSVPQRSRMMLEELVRAHHRGPSDTWTAARDRVAIAAGIKPSYARHVWFRWAEIADVSGEAFWRLLVAYDALCARQEQAAAEMRAAREEAGNGAATGEGLRVPRVGMAALATGGLAPAAPSRGGR